MFKSTLRKLPKLIFTKRFLVTFCLLTITFTGIAHAGIYSPQAFQDALKKAGTSKQKFDAQSTTNLLNTNFCILTGCDDEANDFKKGALGTSTEMVAMLYTPPASGVMYVADVINKFGVVQPAYAQSAGFGFANLNALLPIWRAFRDFTYLFFVLILVVAGFGIMFRWKLNPQTVITIQSALPRIVIALLLVTFSYAIAGLVVDFLYVLIAIPAMIWGPIWNPATPATGIHDLQDQFLRGNFADLAGALWGQTVPLSALSLGATGLVAMVGGILGAVYLAPIALVASIGIGAGVGALLVGLIIAIIIIVQLFRLFFALLQTYIAIILLIVLAPVQIALGVVPGFPGFGAWFKSLIANILVFVAIAVVLMLGMVISHQLNTNTLWAPPFLPGIVPTFASGLIGLGILLVIHQVPQLVRNALGVRGLGLNPMETAQRAGGWPIRLAAGRVEAEVGVVERDTHQVADQGRMIGGLLRAIGGR